jgi:hemerythrin-like metal-binding protein
VYCFDEAVARYAAAEVLRFGNIRGACGKVRRRKLDFVGVCSAAAAIAREGEMMAAYVPWKPFYSVGDPVLDAEHKEILGILDDLYAAMERAPNHPASTAVWKRLVQYTNSHFKHEERVMQEHEYPGLSEHVAQHARLRQRTADLQMHSDLVTSRDLLRFVKEWWLEHIQGEDRKYAPYLTACAT